MGLTGPVFSKLAGTWKLLAHICIFKYIYTPKHSHRGNIKTTFYDSFADDFKGKQNLREIINLINTSLTISFIRE